MFDTYREVMQIRPDIYPIKNKDKVSGLGKWHVGFKVSMTWRDLGLFLRRVLKRKK